MTQFGSSGRASECMSLSLSIYMCAHILTSFATPLFNPQRHVTGMLCVAQRGVLCFVIIRALYAPNDIHLAAHSLINKHARSRIASAHLSDETRRESKSCFNPKWTFCCARSKTGNWYFNRCAILIAPAAASRNIYIIYYIRRIACEMHTVI